MGTRTSLPTNHRTASETAIRLVWSHDGRVECSEHAPYPGSDTWRDGRYQIVPRTPDTRDLRCEVCGSGAA